MPYSDGSNRPWLLEKIQKCLPAAGVRVVDVGAGAGANLEFFKPHLPTSHWTAIEIWEPYVERFSLRERYHELVTGDVSTAPLPVADLYVLGDVLEHLPRDVAIETWNRCRERSRFVAASLPIVHYPQGAAFGNPYETHRHHWSVREFIDSMPGIVDHDYGTVVGAFWAEGS